MANLDDVRQAVRDVPDFPIQGVTFKDLTPILADPELFRAACEPLIERAQACEASRIAAIESRGFLFGAVLSRELNLPLFPVRKAGKLPWKTVAQAYELEYGEAVLEIHQDAVQPGDRVFIVDDLLATGGTAAATAQLIERLDADVAEIAFLVELGFLNGREKLGTYPLFSAVVF